MSAWDDVGARGKMMMEDTMYFWMGYHQIVLRAGERRFLGSRAGSRHTRWNFTSVLYALIKT